VSYRTAAIILSDRAAAGTRADACIPVIRELLGDAFLLEDAQVLPDEPAALAAALISLADVQEYALILTSGGTGLGPRDRTPQTTASVLDYEMLDCRRPWAFADHQSARQPEGCARDPGDRSAGPPACARPPRRRGHRWLAS